MTSAVDDVDELWTFGNASGAVPLSDSSGIYIGISCNRLGLPLAIDPTKKRVLGCLLCMPSLPATLIAGSLKQSVRRKDLQRPS